MIACERAGPPRSRRGNQSEDLTRFGKASDRLLGEDQPAVGDDVEDAAAARDESGIEAPGLLELGRQTGGTGQIVSLLAVGDLERHGCTSVVANDNMTLVPGTARVQNGDAVGMTHFGR